MFYEISILLNLVLILYVIKKIGAESKNSIQILFLKSQLSAYKRKRKKFHTKPFERLKLVFLSYLDPNWIENLILVSPHTLLEWRNKKFKTFWALLSRRKKTGRPNIPWKVIKLIRRVAKENKIWGATKLHGLLLKLDHDICERTVSKYIPKRPHSPKKRLSWKEFYSLHADSMVVSDTLSVYSSNFKKIFRVVFFLHVGSRQILHFDIHTNPTTNWMRKVLKFAVRKQIQAGKTFHYFLSDNDSIFGKRFTKYLERIGIKHKKTSLRSPWQNCYAERWVKTCRNEFLDFFIPLNQYHLEKKLEEFIHFYNHHRTHLALNKDSPVSSPVLIRPSDGSVKLVSTPVLGGLYHIYSYEDVA
ncbi:integrase core domain-containing protein [Leptospira weilii]|uniref:integrase core domain-containing protein n=1 Tax=Leptospira weilii TaxID=28184 RepID=UPI00030C87D6|nr:integrase core domain-containing protein [Leptospira weilii]QDK22408.1 transposase [Leptospira weilii]QDK25604.1 transposase [Leptospira weilii]ULH28436.1 integrase core domain-containing protein [Leptospira weilii]UPY79981.1 integrase core domain-containing protein [Leptospira weilii]